MDGFVQSLENIEDHLLDTGLCFEKIFDRPNCDFCRQFVGEMKLPRGNAAERYAFQLVFCCQLQAGAVAGGEQFFVLFSYSTADDRTDRMQHIAAGQIECGRDFRLSGGFRTVLLFHPFRTGKPQLHACKGVNGVVDAAVAGI